MRKNTSIILIYFYVLFLSANLGHSKNIAIFIDGTWNHPDQAQNEGDDTTNVYRMYRLALNDCEKQVTKYFRGLGTDKSVLLDRKLGGIYGKGAEKIKENAHEFLCENYKSGDKIFIFGFSRGAAISRDLANHIHKKGVINNKSHFFPSVSIEVLGLWDTVAAFGIPLNFAGIPFGDINLGKELDIPPNVEKTYHLVAIDEKREPFYPTLVEANEKVEEIWFAGVHADVGGGYKDRHLADITLTYMITKVEMHGLLFFGEEVDKIQQNASLEEGIIHDNTGKFPLKHRKLIIRKNDKESTNKKVLIHRSVLKRMDRIADYDPENLKSLNGEFIVVE